MAGQGACVTMWRLAHDPVRHTLQARKPLVMAKENITLKKGVPMKMLWLKRGDANLSEPPGNAIQEAQPPQPVTHA